MLIFCQIEQYNGLFSVIGAMEGVSLFCVFVQQIAFFFLKMRSFLSLVKGYMLAINQVLVFRGLDLGTSSKFCVCMCFGSFACTYLCRKIQPSGWDMI